MKIAEILFKQIFEYHKTFVIPDGNWCDFEACKKDGTYAMVEDFAKQYAREAIKADRLNVAKYAVCNEDYIIIEDSIINAPQIDLP